MPVIVNDDGQVTVPEWVRHALHLGPDRLVEFGFNRDGDLVIRKAGRRAAQRPDRFDVSRGKADVKWRTDELMALLRGGN